MISSFDIYELMPRTDCGKCTYGSCIKMAEMLAKGKARVKDCSVMASGGISANAKEIEELLKEK